MTIGRIGELNLAWMPIRIQDRGETWHELSIMLDTGFTGQLALPERYVRQLGLDMSLEARVTPATGQTIPVPAGRAVIIWQDRRRRVRVIQSGTHPLLGMALLSNHRITIDAVPDGPVTITPIGG